MVLGTLRQQLLYPTWTENAYPIADSTKQKGILFYHPLPFFFFFNLAFFFFRITIIWEHFVLNHVRVVLNVSIYKSGLTLH